MESRLADELIQVVGMSWVGRGPYPGAYEAEKPMREQANQIADKTVHDEDSSH